MKILLLSTAFNGLSQRIYVELIERGHTVSVELALSEQVMIEAVELFKPDLIICPFLKQKVPERIWREHVCLIIHPGIKGDRGPSSLDWAIQNQETEWGVTVLQAVDEMDAGDIWATAAFTMRPGAKSSIYAVEVTEAAVKAVLQALEHFQDTNFEPEVLDYNKPDVLGRLRPAMKQEQRTIDWRYDSTTAILAKINAADGSPGVLDTLLGHQVYLYGAAPESNLRGKPGELLAKRDGAICRATSDGALWISHLKPKTDSAGKPAIKLPATMVLKDAVNGLSEIPLSIYQRSSATFREIWYEEKNAVGYLHFDFHNGAMSTGQCLRLLDAVKEVKTHPARVLVLMGGRSVWSNGIHLNIIEASNNPAEESWQNINAIDDLVHEILTIDNKITVAAVHGNAGAGGVPFALACDKVCVRSGVVFNPHYKSMGLYGSEYWTYSLPRRVGFEKAQEITDACMPMGMQEAKHIGLIDFIIPELLAAFDGKIQIMAETLAQSNNYQKILESKLKRRSYEEFVKPLKYYRQEELRHMREEFFRPNSSYHPSRKQFIYKVNATETPKRLALHRQIPGDNESILPLKIRNTHQADH